MEYVSVSEAARTWGLSERSVRNYCAQGRVDGALLEGKTWRIPHDAPKPRRANARSQQRTLLTALRQEKEASMPGGIYHRVQIDLTYNSNHIEGSTLTPDQTCLIFETATILPEGESVRVDDIIETSNHFRAIDAIIDNANRVLTPAFVKRLHAILKAGTTDARREWFRVGEWKALPNEVGGRMTSAPENVEQDIQRLIAEYERIDSPSLDDLLDFHVRFEQIHPFQDGNGRVGRLILFKECLRHGIVPFILTEELRGFYYRGLSQWEEERGYLRDTCLTAQDKFKAMLRAFEVDA